MKKRRILTAVAAAVMALTMSACSDTAQIGAAFTAGDVRMSEQQLTDLVKESQQAQKSLGVQQAANADVTVAAINAHIWQSIIATAAKAKNTTVTDSDVTRILENQYQKSGKNVVLGQLASAGYPPRIVNDYARMVLLQNKVSLAVAGSLQGTVAQSTVNAFWSKTAADMKISVAPRYGTWSTAELRVLPVSNPNATPGK